MATSEAMSVSVATRERQISSYDDLNGLTFGALKRLASENGIKLAKFPKKHDIIKQILIQAEGNGEIAEAIAQAVPQAPHVSSTNTPSTETAPRPQTTSVAQESSTTTNASVQRQERKRVEFAREKKEEEKGGNHERTPSQQARFAGARARAETTAIMSDTHRNKPLPANPKKPPLKSSVTMGDVVRGKHRARASSLPAKATFDTAELFSMNFTQLKNHALNLGLEIPRVPTKGKILRMILAYQPDDFDVDVDDDSESEDAVKGEEKEEKEEEQENREESPPTEVPAAPAAEAAIVQEENKPSDLMAMWRSKSQDSNKSNRSPSPSAASQSASQGKKKSNLMSMWQERAEADKTPSPRTASPGPRKGGAVSKFAEKLANQNTPVGGAVRNQGRQAKSVSPSPRSNEASATEEKEETNAVANGPTGNAPGSSADVSEAQSGEAATEEKKDAEPEAVSVKSREELDAMGFKALKKYITNELGLSLPRVPNRANCIKTILKHQSGETEEEHTPKRPIKLKPKPKPKDVASEIGGTSIADRLKMIAASQANHGVPPPKSGGGTGGASASSGPKKVGRIADRFGNQDEEAKTTASDQPLAGSEQNGAERPKPKPRKKKIGKVGKIGGMGMAINIAALRPGFRPKPRARSGSMVTTRMEFDNLELLRPTIQSGRRKSRIRGPGRSDAAQRILVEQDED